MPHLDAFHCSEFAIEINNIIQMLQTVERPPVLCSLNLLHIYYTLMKFLQKKGVTSADKFDEKYYGSKDEVLKLMNVSNKIYASLQRDDTFTQEQKDELGDNLLSVTQFINLYVADKQHPDFKRKNGIETTGFKNLSPLNIVLNHGSTIVCYPEEGNVRIGKFSIKNDNDVSVDDYWTSF